MILIDDPDLYAAKIPHDVYDELRAQPLLYLNAGAHPFYAVTRYDDAVTVLRDPKLYSSSLRGISIEDPTPAVRSAMQSMLPWLDPPDHMALRQKLFPPLIPGQLTRFKAEIETACHRLIDNALAHPETDFVHSIAAEIPLLVLGSFMGLERTELEPLRAPSDAIIENGSNRSEAAITLMLELLDALVEDRLQHPRDDYMTLLANVNIGAEPMERLARNGMLIQIVIGGLETTRSAIAGTLVALDENRAQWELMRTQPNLIANAVEESLRFVSPINYVRRTTSAPATLGNTSLPADARVVVWLTAANRDAARFADPHRFDVTRSNAKVHVALGAGEHFCMGAGLARLQLVVFWTVFTQRIRDFILTGLPRRAPLLQQNLLKSVPVTLIPA